MTALRPATARGQEMGREWCIGSGMYIDHPLPRHRMMSRTEQCGACGRTVFVRKNGRLAKHPAGGAQ